VLQSQIQANAQYTDGPGDPTGETPPALMWGLQEMLLSSFNTTIHVFRGWGRDSGDASFHDLRAEGAFALSANFSGGETCFVRVVSVARDAVARIAARTLRTPLAVSPAGVPFTVDPASGVVSITLSRGQPALLYPADAAPRSFVVAPVAQPSGSSNHWGLRLPQAARAA